MNIKILFVGSTGEKNLKEGIEKYLKRLKHYTRIDYVEISSVKAGKARDERKVKEMEGELLMKQLDASDHVVLLDERGEMYSSVEFSAFIQKKLNAATRCLVFIAGGPFGFSDAIYNRSNEQLSLSKMTFSHEMVRLFFLEQLYRAHTILKGEKYHHD